jgi:hypothetical protein
MLLDIICHQLNPDLTVTITQETIEVSNEDVYEKYDRMTDPMLLNDPRRLSSDDQFLLRCRHAL